MSTDRRTLRRRGPGICYSGYRDGQSPVTATYPDREEIRADLHLLATDWHHLRLYDCSVHAEHVLSVIEQDRLPLRVLLGATLAAELSNPGCPWGASYSETTLAAGRSENDREVERLIALARRYPEVVEAVAIGNEALVDWTDHLVPVERVIALVRRARSAIVQPVTVCENHVPWRNGLDALAAELDFLAIHSYPVWEWRGIGEALACTRDDLAAVRARHPELPLVLTEAGWTTRSNGRGILPHNASEALQAAYLADLLAWSAEEGILTYVFEAFDEAWKGSPDADEPEKHWGIYTSARSPKQAVRDGCPWPERRLRQSAG